jgi:hypothetical protein
MRMVVTLWRVCVCVCVCVRVAVSSGGGPALVRSTLRASSVRTCDACVCVWYCVCVCVSILRNAIMRGGGGGGGGGGDVDGWCCRCMQVQRCEMGTEYAPVRTRAQPALPLLPAAPCASRIKSAQVVVGICAWQMHESKLNCGGKDEESMEPPCAHPCPPPPLPALVTPTHA